MTIPPHHSAVVSVNLIFKCQPLSAVQQNTELQSSWWWELKIIALLVLVLLLFYASHYRFNTSRNKKLSERTSRRIRFHPQVEELHYHQEPEEHDKRKVKADKMSVGLFNPIKFLNSIDQWRIEKFETEIWQNFHWPWLLDDMHWMEEVRKFESKWTTKWYWVFIF